MGDDFLQPQARFLSLADIILELRGQDSRIPDKAGIFNGSLKYRSPEGAGYYTNVSQALNDAYADGYAHNTPSSATIVYTFGHHHIGNSTSGGGCYGQRCTSPAVYCDGTMEGPYGSQYATPYHSGGDQWAVCNKCGRWAAQPDEVIQQHGNIYGGICGRLISSGSTYYAMNCGKSEGQVVRTGNVLNTAANEKLIEAKIVYN